MNAPDVIVPEREGPIARPTPGTQAIPEPFSTGVAVVPSRTVAENLSPLISQKFIPQVILDSVPLQIWEGEVEDISEADQTMQVILRAKLHARDDHTAEIALKWVAPQDRNLVKRGAVFYLTLYMRTERGSIQNSQELRFRRLPSWSKLQLAHVARDAVAMAAKMRAHRPADD